MHVNFTAFNHDMECEDIVKEFGTVANFGRYFDVNAQWETPERKKKQFI